MDEEDVAAGTAAHATWISEQKPAAVVMLVRKQGSARARMVTGRASSLEAAAGSSR